MSTGNSDPYFTLYHVFEKISHDFFLVFTDMSTMQERFQVNGPCGLQSLAKLDHERCA